MIPGQTLNRIRLFYFFSPVKMFVVVIRITRAVGSKGINLCGFYLTLSSLSTE